MQGYLLGIFFILLLVVIDFCLQKKINKKGYVFLCMLYMLRIIDKLIYIDKK